MNRARRSSQNPNQQTNDQNVMKIVHQVGTPSSMPLKAPVKSILKKDPRPPSVEKVEPEAKPAIINTPVQAAMVPIPKEEPVQSMNTDEELIEKMDENGTSSRKPFFKKIFGGVRKKPSVRAKERKIRQNRHLRKVILPKNALMALYEIKGIQIGDFIINSNMEGGFTALVTVNGCQYEAVGNSKNNAKTNACEKAIRDYVIKKMMQKPRDKTNAEPMEIGDENKSGDATNGEEGNTSGDEADDVPMVNLASFALYKLFTAWENEGFHVPEFHPNPPQHNSQQNAGEATPAKKPVGRNELPPNWEIMHPATLLCIMRPRLTYTDCGKTGDSLNPSQTVKVVVDDREFIGVGRSKKVARKNVAIAVCNSLFGTNFQLTPQEE